MRTSHKSHKFHLHAQQRSANCGVLTTDKTAELGQILICILGIPDLYSRGRSSILTADSTSSLKFSSSLYGRILGEQRKINDYHSLPHHFIIIYFHITIKRYVMKSTKKASINNSTIHKSTDHDVLGTR